MNAILEFDSVNLSFGTRSILSSVAVECRTGDIVGILGRNGSGKSSLMQVVFGSLTSDYKSVRINGKSLQGNYLSGRHMAYLPQHNLIPNSIRIDKALSLYEIDEDDLLMEFPEAGEWLKHYPQQLAGGSRRVLEVLLILKSRATFCLLDEPFTGVMPVQVTRLQQIILDARRSKGISITDHLYQDVMTIANRLLVLSNGQTYSVNNAEELRVRGYLT